MLQRLIPFLFIAALIEFYTYRAFSLAFTNKKVRFAYWLTTIIAWSVIVYELITLKIDDGQTFGFQLMVGLFVLMYIPKFLIFILIFGNDVLSFSGRVLRRFLQPKNTTPYLPARKTFIAQSALALAAIPFWAVIHGVTIGKFNFKKHFHRLIFDDLPESFDGFRILQISDIHTGSILARDMEKIEAAVKMINEQRADLIVYTGDLVNNFAEETVPWIDVLKKINRAPYGNFAVMGNHDYGEYTRWNSEEAKQQNVKDIQEAYRKIGFQLLLNEHVTIAKEKDKIQLIGVENWGSRFIQKADIPKATKGVHPADFKIFLTHDPSHWDMKIKEHPLNFQLTFSGHTHGMQMGIEVPNLGVKWSPSQYIYKQWAGLYEHQKRFIYVNRGFGYHFFPGRIGILPEITVVELKKA
ncbi:MULTISPECIES: metallophosphoesterase [Weeksella]|uniref:Metallophosphoesterase n=1 Tax=Weeksella virosa (strain ATCC 43766 / DSM 16922 / JCM 21250 / CCUG 30538 / CDC 9751 / IAM 14551 / NBRC 16016 / NCTC 11634 / CL345/78) TaxID=865938 RepID=F0P122_WEEVC|nr:MULTISPECIES: metallophosphoesterase [Weeksella]ADX68606.1 metallophosphoesterase [Weeksella virosa DSM 16922]MDK7375177.1 metallophosphoesterase [Weeksella virosa]MDK7675219.1 metallophosphoesterase [Weeksella virosa]OFM85675.1 phosphoesterase [Weeksella sp. HMSC059D05]VEH63731.1 phosphodiesterase YaeI [Weeksella virosa]